MPIPEDTRPDAPAPHVQAAAEAAGFALGLTDRSVRHLATVMAVFCDQDNGGRPGPSAPIDDPDLPSLVASIDRGLVAHDDLLARQADALRALAADIGSGAVGVVERHLRGDDVDLEPVAARPGRR